jgi:hypothetical protein
MGEKKMMWNLKLFAFLFIIWGLIVALAFNPKAGAEKMKTSVERAWFLATIFLTSVSFTLIWLLKGLL